MKGGISFRINRTEKFHPIAIAFGTLQQTYALMRNGKNRILACKQLQARMK